MSRRDIGLGLVHPFGGIGVLHPSVNPFLDNYRYNNGLPGGVSYEDSYQILYGDGGGGGADGIDVSQNVNPTAWQESAPGIIPAGVGVPTQGLLPGEWRQGVTIPPGASAPTQGNVPKNDNTMGLIEPDYAFDFALGGIAAKSIPVITEAGKKAFGLILGGLANKGSAMYNQYIDRVYPQIPPVDDKVFEDIKSGYYD